MSAVLKIRPDIDLPQYGDGDGDGPSALICPDCECDAWRLYAGAELTCICAVCGTEIDLDAALDDPDL